MLMISAGIFLAKRNLRFIALVWDMDLVDLTFHEIPFASVAVGKIAELDTLTVSSVVFKNANDVAPLIC